MWLCWTICGSVSWIRTVATSKGNSCIYNPGISLAVQQWQNFYKMMMFQMVVLGSEIAPSP